MLRNSDDRYGALAISLHWIMALLIIGLFGFGLWMVDLPRNDFRVAMFGLHKSIGVLFMLLLVTRLIWRSINPTPKPIDGPAWQQAAAYWAHIALYGLMIAVPLTGWLMSDASGRGVSFFGLFSLPHLVAVDKPMKEFWEGTHEVLAKVMLGLAFIHAAAAIWHHRVKKDRTMVRMLPLLG
jgi:cytochrome b561